MTSSEPGREEPRNQHGGPAISVVVPAVNGCNILLRALDALAAQSGGHSVEMVVPERLGGTLREEVLERHPGTKVISVPAGTSIPAMRRMAMEAATAPVLAVIEDHVIVPPDWVDRLVTSVGVDSPVVGGWVENTATDTLADRAAFICEYGHMLRTLPSGRVGWLTGNNVAYARDVVRRFWPVIEEERWEDRLHGAIAEAGIPLTLDSELVVGHHMHYRSAAEYAGQRYLYSRAFAAMRLRGAPTAVKLARGVASLILPPVLLARIVRNAWADPGSRGDMVVSLPLLVFFVTVWAVGEFVGALAGSGDALGRIR